MMHGRAGTQWLESARKHERMDITTQLIDPMFIYNYTMTNDRNHYEVRTRCQGQHSVF